MSNCLCIAKGIKVLRDKLESIRSRKSDLHRENSMVQVTIVNININKENIK